MVGVSVGEPTRKSDVSFYVGCLVAISVAPV
jgi:hypothetical protein